MFVLCFWTLLVPPIQSHSAVITYQYDNLNRLVKVRYEGGAAISYSYDPAGNRLIRRVILNGQSLLADLNDDESVTLTDAILALKVISGLSPDGIRSQYGASGADIGGNRKIGPEEVIYILQRVSELRN
jgi:YD repeat-containing protein